jgi:hypothetical protein
VVRSSPDRWSRRSAPLLAGGHNPRPPRRCPAPPQSISRHFVGKGGCHAELYSNHHPHHWRRPYPDSLIGHGRTSRLPPPSSPTLASTPALPSAGEAPTHRRRSFPHRGARCRLASPSAGCVLRQGPLVAWRLELPAGWAIACVTGTWQGDEGRPRSLDCVRGEMDSEGCDAPGFNLPSLTLITESAESNRSNTGQT